MVTDIPLDYNVQNQPKICATKKQLLFGSKLFIKRLIARKPMREIQAEIEIQNELKRALNLFQLISVGLGAIIGNKD